MTSAKKQLSFDDMAPSPGAFTTITPVEPRQASVPFHPLANVFPLLGGPEFDELVADIEAHGVLEPIWLYQGQVLDGRNRYNACEALGLACPSREYDGEDPVGFVVSLNLKRRHLDESRRGMLAARLATMRQGQRTDLPSIDGRLSQEEAAALVNVGIATVQRATKVQQVGAPEIVHAVDAGEITVSAALPLTALPKAEQAAAWGEVQHAVDGKKPTATSTKAVVTRAQVVATVKEQMADGKTAHEAVKHALQRYEVDTPTPALAEALAQATNHQVTLRATDGRSHDGRTPAERAVQKAHADRVSVVAHALEVLATWDDLGEIHDDGEVIFDQALLKEFVADMTDADVDYVEPWLNQALENVTQFVTWVKQAHQPPPEEASVSRLSAIQLAYDQVVVRLRQLGKVITIAEATRDTDVLPKMGHRVFARLIEEKRVRHAKGKKGHYVNLCRRTAVKEQATKRGSDALQCQ